MNYRFVIVPLLAVAIFAIIVLVIVWWYRRRHDEIQVEERLARNLDAEKMCGAKNPRTGWICERWEGHYDNHWQEIRGERYDWPDDD